MFSVRGLAERYGVPYSFIYCKADFKELEIGSGVLGVTLNFDVIIPEFFIRSYKYGILNIHASDLPRDKGISPVVWAYCRGDRKIWTSCYSMDGGIDTGNVIKKDVALVENGWSLFRTYCEVLIVSARLLCAVIDNVKTIDCSKDGVNTDGIEGTYNAWPDVGLRQVMKKQGRIYFSVSDINYLRSVLSSL